MDVRIYGLGEVQGRASQEPRVAAATECAGSGGGGALARAAGGAGARTLLTADGSCWFGMEARTVDGRCWLKLVAAL
jgi:hypothetical protein